MPPAGFEPNTYDFRDLCTTNRAAVTGIREFKDWTTVSCAKGYFLYKRNSTIMPLPGIEPETYDLKSRFTDFKPQPRLE